ncbi:MAG: HRDC domain-containing protein [Myxococcales bacterium]
MDGQTAPRSPLLPMTDFDWIANQHDFEGVLDQLQRADAYALDTEFHRERTYLPRLALVQLATRHRITLVDALAVDLRPIRTIFARESVCVMHAGSQDLEILELACDAVPRRIFDTQVAALFCGYRTTSLGRLVEGVLGVSLDKSAQLTDWIRRPLPQSDLRYAASDVAHLLDLRDALSEALEKRGRLHWAEEEIERLRSKDRTPPDPETLWWKLRGKTKLGGKARGVAQELAIWRDQTAKQLNRPPRSVLSDMALMALAQRPPKRAQQLRGVRGLDPRHLKHADELLAAIERGVELPKSALRLPPKPPEPRANVEGVVSLCLAWLGQRAAMEDLDPSVLGTRDDVASLVLGEPSRLSTGWRNALVGGELRSIIDGTAVLRVEGNALELLDRLP